MSPVVKFQKPETGKVEKAETAVTLREWIKEHKRITCPFEEMNEYGKKFVEECKGHFAFLFHEIHFVDSVGNIATFDVPPIGAVAELKGEGWVSEDGWIKALGKKILELNFVHNQALQAFMLDWERKNREKKAKQGKKEFDL